MSKYFSLQYFYAFRLDQDSSLATVSISVAPHKTLNLLAVKGEFNRSCNHFVTKPELHNYLE